MSSSAALSLRHGLKYVTWVRTALASQLLNRGEYKRRQGMPLELPGAEITYVYVLLTYGFGVEALDCGTFQWQALSILSRHGRPDANAAAGIQYQ